LRDALLIFQFIDERQDNGMKNANSIAEPSMPTFLQIDGSWVSGCRRRKAIPEFQ